MNRTIVRSRQASDRFQRRANGSSAATQSAARSYGPAETTVEKVGFSCHELERALHYYEVAEVQIAIEKIEFDHSMTGDTYLTPYLTTLVEFAKRARRSTHQALDVQLRLLDQNEVPENCLATYDRMILREMAQKQGGR